MRTDCSRALVSAGIRIEISTAMMPMTTSSSTSVNATDERRRTARGRPRQPTQEGDRDGIPTSAFQIPDRREATIVATGTAEPDCIIVSKELHLLHIGFGARRTGFARNTGS